MSKRRIALRAPAKLNLTLAVGGVRADGFHELDTVLMGIGLEDRLVAEAQAVGCTLELSGPAASGVPEDASNLALRAARAVLELARARGLEAGGVRLLLEKHIPAKAGLGGGSSDAAAAAYAAARLFGIDPDDPELRAALSVLGSDCAFFLEARRTGLARCTGRGELVEPWPRVSWPWSLAVVTPSFGCATGAVYRALASVRSQPERAAHRVDAFPRSSLSLGELRAGLFNELEPAALHAEPRLRGFRAHLEHCAPGAFRLAGSGSSWFGFFPDEPCARAVVERVHSASEGRGYALRSRWVGPARSVGSEP